MLKSKDDDIRLKRPCKLCMHHVTHKTGIQCTGLCRQWTHFRCLGYSSEKILDIRKGLITVKCPCRSCESKLNESLNRAESDSGGAEYSDNAVYKSSRPVHTYMHSTGRKISCSRLSPSVRPSPPPLSLPKSPPDGYDRPHRVKGCSRSRERVPKISRCRQRSPPRKCSKERCTKKCSKESCSKKNCKKSNRSKKSPSLCIIPGKGSCPSKQCLISSSDSCMDARKHDVSSMMVALQDMCNTVGTLSAQIKYIMCKMMDLEKTKFLVALAYCLYAFNTLEVSEHWQASKVPEKLRDFQALLGYS